MTWFKRIGLLLLLLLFLLMALIAYVTMTHGGMQRMLSLGQSYLVEDLKIENAEGKLVGPGSFSGITFNNPQGVDVKVDSINYDWQPKRLFSRELNVNQLDITGVTVRLPVTEPTAEGEASEPFKLSDLRIPFAVDVDRLSIKDINIYPPGAETPFVVDEILLRAGGEDHSLKLVELLVNTPQGNAKLGGTLNTNGDWPVELESDWNFMHPQFGEFVGAGTITGDLTDLNVIHEVEGLVDLKINADIKDATGNFSWDGNIVASSDDLQPVAEGLNGVPFVLNTDTSGSLESFNAQGTLASLHPQTGAVETAFNLVGDLDQIRVKDSIVIFQDSPAKIKYQGSVDLKSLEADMTVDWTELVYPLVTEPALVQSPNGTLRFMGSAQQYKVQMNGEVQQEQTGLLNIVAGVSGTPEKITLNTLSAEGPPTAVYTVGVIDLVTREIDIKGNWKDVRWPLVGEEEMLRSSAAEFSVAGTLDDYKVDADFSLAGKDIPAGDWVLSTRGNTESLNGLSLEGDVLQGNVSATGDVVFSPTPEWDLTLAAQDINPGEQWQEHEGKITFASNIQGSMTETGPEFIAQVQDLSGNYRGQPLAGGGQVSMTDGEMSAEGMKVKVGSATVDIDGAIGDELDLALQLDAEDLTHLVPGIEGDIDIKGKLTGTRDAPVLDFNLSARDFKSGTTQVASLNGKGLVDLTGKSPSSFTVTGESLQASGYQWQKLSIEGEGRPEQHQLTLSLASEAAPNIKFNLKGGVANEQWTGSIEQLDLLKTPAGDWKLFEPVAIVATQESLQTKILCLTNLPAVTCVDGAWKSSTGVKGRLAIEHFNSELISDLMPPDIMVDAPLSGTVDFSMANGGKPNATAQFDIPAGKVQFESSGDVITAVLGESQINAVLADNRVNTDVDMALGEIGTIKAAVLVDDLYGRQNLSGVVKSEVQDISLAGIGASQLQSIDGAFFSSLKLAGTLAAPILEGDLSLENFAAEIPSLSLKLTDGVVKAVSDGNGRLNIDGSIKSGDGDLGINGYYNTKSGQMEISLEGDDFQVANAERQKAVLSPDLEIKIDDEMISVIGDLVIPSAFIQAGGDSGVVVESPDVIVSEASDETTEEAENSRVKLGVNVSLGDDVRVRAGQFDGALGGGIAIEQLPGKVPTGSGAIEVVSGDFLVYGQKLTMERGRILFGGGPLDNPALDIDVARDVAAYDVKAGAQVRGTAQAPLLELQSDPPQTDANTLSYILFGKPVGTGLSYTLGKFITPDLYVSYGVDLFDKIQTYNLRYKISQRLALMAASSSNGKSSADVVYTIER